MYQIKKLIKNPITYKILSDIFLILLSIIIFFLISETILPGLISFYISPLTLFFYAFSIILLISLTAQKQNIYTPIIKQKKRTRMIVSFLFIIFVLIAGSKYSYLFDIIIVLFSIIIFFLINTLFLEILHTKHTE